jgi:hypothetical protein
LTSGERRRPVLVDNMFQVFVAPLFLIAEADIALGLKKRLARDVAALMPRHLPDPAPEPAPEAAPDPAPGRTNASTRA